MQILNIAAYKFIRLMPTRLTEVYAHLKSHAQQAGIKGTILLSTEGINLMLAGFADEIAAFKENLCTLPEFSDLHYKNSFSSQIPFKRLLIKIKDEIITFKVPTIKPEEVVAPYIDPLTLKQWYEEGRDMVVLDTRNNYEITFGRFEKAMDLNIENFTEFVYAINQLPDDFKTKPVVTYCTGGIRCEKAATLLQQQGFTQVYQLQGGILNYFEQCGGAHYQGECFVFDDRITVNPNLKES